MGSGNRNGRRPRQRARPLPRRSDLAPAGAQVCPCADRSDPALPAARGDRRAGAAARAFLETYRQHNDTDELHLFGREPHGFYNRVQLPEYLTGRRDLERLRTMAEARLEALRVHFHRGVEVVAIDRAARVVRTGDGTQLRYDRLVLATGSRAFVPPGVPW
ncbi:FAD-dependent oxidoreductase, partial [Rhodothermus marinus]|uniref:FAD-dependent oxidoreductase n=1 Tax=Rhodothermus marinus TaxID=29549 RepID=UPI001FB24FE2